MKYIKYTLRSSINCGTLTEPKWEDIFLAKAIPWSETNEEIAKQEAYNGQYTIES